MRPYQGFWGFGEKGYLFSGSWGALANILRDLGSQQVFGEQKKKTFRELRKNKSGSWGEGSIFSGSREQRPPLVGPRLFPYFSFEAIANDSTIYIIIFFSQDFPSPHYSNTTAPGSTVDGERPEQCSATSSLTVLRRGSNLKDTFQHPRGSNSLVS